MSSAGGWGQDTVISPCSSFLLALFFLCSSVGPPQASVPSGVCLFPPQNTFYSSDFGVPYFISPLFPPLSPWCFLPFIKLEVPPASAKGSAMSFGGSVAESAEMGCVCHGTTPGLFSQRSPLQPLSPPTNTLPFTPSAPCLLVGLMFPLVGWGKGVVLCGLGGFWLALFSCVHRSLALQSSFNTLSHWISHLWRWMSAKRQETGE